MPDRCSVPCCKSGYETVNSAKCVSFHKFPDDPTLLTAWLNKIPREFQTLPKQARVCSKHFCELDFSTDTFDSNPTRRKHRQQALVSLSIHLLQEHSFNFVMLGKFSSDPIEGRFGWYRQSCGGSYFVTVRQIFNSEKNIRVLSFMRTLNDAESEDRDRLLKNANRQFNESISNVGFPEKCFGISDGDEWLAESLCDLSLDNLDTDNIPIVYRVAGYVGRTVSRRRRCSFCHELLLVSTPTSSNCSIKQCFSDHRVQSAQDLFNQVNRGGLSHPQECLLVLCAIAFHYMQLIECDSNIYRKFMCSSSQRLMFVRVVVDKISSSTLSCLSELKCSQEYCVAPNILFCIFNCFSKSSLKRLNETDATSNKCNVSTRKVKKLQSL